MDTDLEILIRAIADKKSADDATKQLVDRVFAKLKDGTIKLPINSELDKSELKKLDDNVKQARKEVVRRYNKLQKEMANPEGFDAFSDKAINELIELGKAYATFNSKAGGRSKNSMKAIADVKSALGEVFQLYENELKLLNSRIKELNLQDKVSRQLGSTRSRRSSKSAEAYDRYLTKQEKYSKQAEGAGERKELFNELDYVRKNKSPGSLGNRMIRGVATKRTLQETDYAGSYPSGFARQMAKSREESRKRELASLKVERNKEKAEQRAKDLEEGKVKYKTKRQVIDKKSNGQIDISYEDAEVYNKKPKQYTDEENNELKRDVITNELAKILGGIEHVRKDVSVQLFKDYMAGAFASNKAAGKNDWKAIQETLEKTLNRYRGDKGTLGITDSTEKGVFGGHAEAVAAIEEMLDYMKEVAEQSEQQGEVSAESARQLKELAKISAKEANKYADELLGKGQQNKESNTVEFNSQIAKEIATMSSATEETHRAIRNSAKETEKVNRSVKIGNTKEAVEFDQAEKISKENKDINRDTAKAVKSDEATGFNTDSKADELINLVRSILNVLQGEKVKEATKPLALPPGNEIEKSLSELRKEWKAAGLSDEQIEQKLAEVSNIRKGKDNKPEGPITTGPKSPKGFTGEVPPYKSEEEKIGVSKSNIYASPFKQGFWKKLKGAFESLTGATKGYEEVLRANAEEQDRMAAERIKIWGMNNGRNPNDTGDIAAMRRVLQLYRTNKTSIENNPELMQKIKLTPGVEIDTTEVTKTLNKALSGRQMKNAQTGGGFLKNVFGFMTGGLGYAFMPSLEKSRAQSDGLNQMFANINKALQSVLTNIQTKETELSGMVESDQAKFDKNGYLTPDSSSAAFKTLADLEEEKWVLDSIRADLAANDEIIKKTGGRFPQMIKHLKFTSPVLKENNGLLRNLNSGLDKNGKALKFQTRLAEILNYTYQLMSRHIGQMVKNWISMANPINLIKKAFNDFGSYDVKWQRTMNVIKINFQRIIKPAMEWIAQKLVNIIGFFNIISMKIQEAFGQIPVDLFDQAGADTEKIHRELEEAANVTAGFDELHDIGSDNSGANDLLGDIYKPQLSDEWKAMAEKIGDLFAGLIKGEKTVGEVFGRIFEMLLDLLGKIAKAIWDWFKQTSLGKWITEHWKGLLASLLAIFLGWKLLKIFGPTLLSVIGGAFKTLLGKVGGWITTLLGASGFGQGIMLAFQSLFAGGKYSLIGTLGEMFTNSAAITQAGSWGSMIGFAITKGLAAALTGYVTYKAIDHFGDNLADKTSYNLGVEYAGGKDKDKKGTALDTIGAIGSGVLGGAATGAIIGGPVGAAVGAVIGGIAGTIQSVLRPALEEAEVAARALNGELQSVSFNEAQVQVFEEQSSELKEQLDLLKQTLDLNTQSIYKQGEELGISKTRMDELIASTQNGTFNTDMLSGAELGLADSLTDLTQKQEHYTKVSKEAEEAERKLLKAKTELSIAQDIEAGNFEMAAARIELAEAQGVYSTEEATDRRIELFEKCSAEERANLLQDLTPDQKKRMTDFNELTDIELAKLNAAWQDSSEVARNALLDGLDENTQAEFKRRMDQIDQEIESHKGFWQGVGDTLAEIFSFGNANTWTYNGEAKYEDEVRKGKIKIQKNALGTNYVEADGLQYLHQGEAIIPKKYNQPYQPQNNAGMENAINNLIQQVAQISNQVNQGIPVKGQFVQRGSDLVATVERANNRMKNNVLNNRVYAR